MGPYCQYCDRRCFLPRIVIKPDGTRWDGIMATCDKGMERDRSALGVDHTEAINPFDMTAEQEELLAATAQSPNT